MSYNTNFDSGAFGIEAIFDFHNCDISKFNADALKSFISEIIKIADMEAQGEPVVWEDHVATESHLRGTSVLQWIQTSNIVLHALDLTNLALLNLFSCKPFDPDKIVQYGKEFFDTNLVNVTIVDRGQFHVTG